MCITNVSFEKCTNAYRIPLDLQLRPVSSVSIISRLCHLFGFVHRSSEPSSCPASSFGIMIQPSHFPHPFKLLCFIMTCSPGIFTPRFRLRTGSRSEQLNHGSTASTDQDYRDTGTTGCNLDAHIYPMCAWSLNRIALKVVYQIVQVLSSHKVNNRAELLDHLGRGQED